jgi:hypothetical protein
MKPSLPNQVIRGFGFENNSELWTALHMLIDASIESEVAAAISKENKGEDRAWYAGRAEALVTFKTILLETRNQVLEHEGRPPETRNPSENGSHS